MKDDCPRCGGSFPAHAFNGHPCVGRGEVHPDLAREIEWLLGPARFDLELRGTFDTWTERVRFLGGDYAYVDEAVPLLAAYVQHKLDEAKADGELLEKVGWLLPRRGQIEIRLDEDGDWYARSALIEHPASVRHGGGAPTLVEALRKLVGEEP